MDEKEYLTKRINKVAKAGKKVKAKGFKQSRKLARQRKELRQRGY